MSKRKTSDITPFLAKRNKIETMESIEMPVILEIPTQHKIDSWSVNEYIEALMKTNPRREVFIPDFQRCFVWTLADQRALIKTLFQKNPCGIITLFKNEYNDMEHYSILDGQQRIVTLLRYCHNPTNYLEEPLDKITPIGVSAALKRDILEWITTRDDAIAPVGTYRDIVENNYPLRKFLLKKQDLAAYGYELELLDDICRKVENALRMLVSSIMNVKIPFCVYFGPETEIAKIYESLNRKHSPLSVFDRYAASWKRYGVFRIYIPEVCTALYTKYTCEKEQRGINYKLSNITNDVAQFHNEKHDLHQFCKGFGAYLQDAYKDVFDDTIDPNMVSLSILRGIYGVKNDRLVHVMLGTNCAEIVDAETHLQFAFTSQAQQTLFMHVNAALHIIRETITRFHNTSKIKLVSSNVQIASIIGRYYALVTRIPVDKNLIKQLKQNLQLHMIYDALSQAWVSRADNQLFNRTQKPHYEYTPTRENWLKLMDKIFIQELQKDTQSRRSITDVAKTLLKLTACHVLSAYDANCVVLHYDHIIPLQKLKQLKDTHPSEIIPANHVANMCILDGTTNMRKQNKTMYEFIRSEMVGQIGKSSKRNELEDIVLWHNVNELEFSETAALTPIAYKSYLTKRFNIIRDRFFNAYGIL